MGCDAGSQRATLPALLLIVFLTLRCPCSLGTLTCNRKHMSFPEPPAEEQELAWKRLLEFFDKELH